MTTALDILNLGLLKISASAVSTIDPPRTALERRGAANYPRWRDSELAKKKWSFALSDPTELTLSGSVPGDSRPYRFLLPNDCVRPLRDRVNGAPCEWVRRGNFLCSAEPTLVFYYIKRVPENDFDPSFVEVLACRVAVEESEPSTESNDKGQTAQWKYDAAVKVAGQLNAFVIGEEDPDNDYDDGYDFITSRY